MLPEEGSPFCSHSGFDVLVLSAEGHPSCSYAFLIFLICLISGRVVKGMCSCTAIGKTHRPDFVLVFGFAGVKGFRHCMAMGKLRKHHRLASRISERGWVGVNIVAVLALQSGRFCNFA